MLGTPKDERVIRSHALLLEKNQKIYIMPVFFLFIVLKIHYYIQFFFCGASGIMAINDPLNPQFPFLKMMYIGTILIIHLIIPIIFSLRAMTSLKKETQLRGKFIFLATITGFLGVLLESFITLPLELFLITRILQLNCSILYYIEFTLPKFIKKFSYNKAPL